jgi:hypothetical protein
MFGDWCKGKNLKTNEVAEQKHPEMWLEECIQWIYDSGGSYTSADICRTAISALFRDWFGVKDVGGNSFVSRTLMSKAETRVPVGRKRRIWKLEKLMNGFRKDVIRSSLSDLDWPVLIGRVGAMLVCFTCCRIAEMVRIVTSKSVWIT